MRRLVRWLVACILLSAATCYAQNVGAEVAGVERRIERLQNMYDAALVSLQQGKYDEAIKSLEYLSTQNFDAMKARYSLGYAYYVKAVVMFSAVANAQAADDEEAAVKAQATTWRDFLVRQAQDDGQAQAGAAFAPQPQANTCQLTVVANRPGLEVRVMDAATGVTATDVVGAIIANPQAAKQLGSGPGASFAAQAVLDANGMAQLWVPSGIALKVEVRSATVVIGAPGGTQGLMKQQTMTIPEGSRTYVIRFTF